MSSRVIAANDGRNATPISWGKLDFTRTSAASPSRTAAGPDDRITQLETALAQLQNRYDADVAGAHRRGFSEGESSAKAGPAAEMEAATQRLVQSVRDLAQMRPRLRRDAEVDVVRLALAIARRILRREMSVDPAAMQALAQVALQRLVRQEVSRVYVHPQQEAAIRTALESAGVRAEIIPEPGRDSGSLVFETNQGKLDASVNAQLEEIERGLTDRFSQI